MSSVPMAAVADKVGQHAVALARDRSALQAFAGRAHGIADGRAQQTAAGPVDK